MAGIGFELRKLHNQHGLLRQIRAYAYSSMSTVGPMILCMAMVAGIQRLMSVSGAAFLERELFLTTIVYAFIFSVLVTGGVSMVLTRFLSDMLFQKQYKHALSSYYGAAAVCLPAGAVAALVFLKGVEAGFAYKAAAFLLFMELILIWLQSVHLTALKDYKRIFRGFLYGACTAGLGAWAVSEYTPYQTAAGMLAAVDAGFFLVVLLTNRHFEQVFPPRDSRLYFHFLSYFSKYPALFGIGTFLYAGVYTHSFVYWFGPENKEVAGRYLVSPFYDTPVFYAYLSVMPTLILFTVAVETNFYEKFRGYYDLIRQRGTFKEISEARREMQRTLIRELTFLMETQLMFTVISLALGIKLLPMIGFSMNQLDVYIILLLGYYFFIITFVILLLLLYYDDRKGVFMISGVFVVLNTGFSVLSMLGGYDGYGMFVASFIAVLLALGRLIIYVRSIDYHTFCAQPINPVKRERRRLFRPGLASVTLAALVILLTGCMDSSLGEKSAPKVTDSPIAEPVTQDKLAEDKRIYERDNDTFVDTLYLTVLEDDKKEDSAPLTWYELNRIRSRMEEGSLAAILQEGAADGSGPAPGSFGYSSQEANAHVSLRGSSTRYASQRSYKIKLNDQAGLWNDQRTINLSKHAYDPSRLRNKLSFDLFETIPNITSLRTRFVHLYVKDLSEDGAASSKPFIDYGLYTQVEQPNKQFLKNHWLDPYGQLYKATMFEFFEYQDELRLQDDPLYDKAKFETRLQINGREDHRKLLDMLKDVNNLSIPINEVIDKHFDLDNYLTWMASNILMDNMDTNVQNFLLYSPLNSEKWYFLPWDYDGGWELQQHSTNNITYSSGISNYWASKLHNRFFRSMENVNLLKDRIDELYRDYINNDIISKRVALYAPITQLYISRQPDKGFFPEPISDIPKDLARISTVPERSMKRFIEDIQKPKPFFLDDLHQEGTASVFQWDASFDLQGDTLKYEFTLARDPLFTKVVKRLSTPGTSVRLSGLSPGTYYWKVTAGDGKGHSQIAFDIYFDDEGTPYNGVREVKVN
ncbi:exopolysaccharide Pel transporter PelG [Paenibacillus zanthoxyli]|uniref:exopolysaccharide Pel transporter PelG n=1 Tax=Paenibacillus zanthoxyli TaxID=369399 RepID=UPI0004B360F9|nr:exopolysaccharide Pel transporter PelG [Paenibacillus zanthoxyli]